MTILTGQEVFLSLVKLGRRVSDPSPFNETDAGPARFLTTGPEVLVEVPST